MTFTNIKKGWINKNCVLVKIQSLRRPSATQTESYSTTALKGGVPQLVFLYSFCTKLIYPVKGRIVQYFHNKATFPAREGTWLDNNSSLCVHQGLVGDIGWEHKLKFFFVLTPRLKGEGVQLLVFLSTQWRWAERPSLSPWSLGLQGENVIAVQLVLV